MASDTTSLAGSEAVATAAFVDGEGRTVAFEPYRQSRYADLVAMYDDFAPSERAQGLPPSTRPAVEEWLEAVLGGRPGGGCDGISLVAVHDDAVVGHAMFVADGTGARELAVFVHQDYQDAGVGTHLLRAGFDHARRAGVTDVWLSVDRSNRRAHAVYERLGFERETTDGRSIKMRRTL